MGRKAQAVSFEMIDRPHQSEVCERQSGVAPRTEGDVWIVGRIADQSVELSLSVRARYPFDIV